MSKADRGATVTLAGIAVPPGRRRRIDLPAGHLVTGTTMSLPAMVVNGRRPGPTIWLSGAIHGDEVNGVRIVDEVVAQANPKDLSGTIIAVPIVSVFGFINESRYLPDRRDLNRLFPGSPRGSLGSRLAHLFMEEVVAPSDFGIDFHTATNHRTNAPQIRADLDDPRTVDLTRAFAAPLSIHARLRDGSLREAAGALGKPVLVFEGGQAHRFDEDIISEAVAGTLRVLAATGMMTAPEAAIPETIEIRYSKWVRARRAGMFHAVVAPGQAVAEGDVLGTISEVLERRRPVVRSPEAGYVIGLAVNPLVNRGDALVHVGS